MIRPGDELVPCIDKLDCGCKKHDYDVYNNQGIRTRGSDSRLANIAIRAAYDPRLPRSTRRKALLVAYGMLAVRPPR